MHKIELDDSGRRYAALRMIEFLFTQGKISEAVYRRSISENAKVNELMSFTGFHVVENGGRRCRK